MSMSRVRYNFEPRTGQQACFRPQGIVGRVIALVRGPMSHAGTIIVTDGRVLVSEQVGGGAQLWPLSAHIANGADIAIRDLPPEHVGLDGWRERLEEFAWSVWGIWHYSMRHLRRHLLYAIIGGPSTDTSGLDEFTDEALVAQVVSMICSERCSFDLRRFAHYDIALGLSDPGVAPRHVYLTDRLVTVVEHAQIVEAAE
jgi:hypothetical protein